MRIINAAVAAFEIHDVKGLDPVLVIWQNYEPGKGRLIVHCFGRCWSAYWGAMAGRDVLTFVNQASAEYVVNTLLRGMRASKSDEKYLTRIIDAVRMAIQMQEAA